MAAAVISICLRRTFQDKDQIFQFGVVQLKEGMEVGLDLHKLGTSTCLDGFYSLGKFIRYIFN